MLDDDFILIQRDRVSGVFHAHVLWVRWVCLDFDGGINQHFSGRKVFNISLSGVVGEGSESNFG